MGIFEDALKCLKQAADEHGNATRLAEFLEVNPNLLSRWFSGDRRPSWKTLAPILERLDVKLYGPGEHGLNELANGAAEDFCLVPKVCARLGAGSSLMTDETPDGYYAFRREWLRHLGPQSKPVLMQVIGASMMPTLCDGDMVMIDEADKEIHSGQLYAVGVGEELLIKRVFRQPDGTILLKSDNSEYPTWTVPQCDDPRIIGRAKWVGREL